MISINKQKAFEVMTNAHRVYVNRELDFLHGDTLHSAQMIADQILATGVTYVELCELETETTQPDIKGNFADIVHLALKYGKSRAAVLEMPAFYVSVVVPAYGENLRLLPRGTGPGCHEHGEDFVVEKHRQLEWLLGGSKSSYQVTFIDDMSRLDPVRSGEAIDLRIGELGISNFRVLFLENAVKNEKGGEGLVAVSLRGAEYPKNTKKAVAVYYGAAKAIEGYKGNLPHLVFFLDCDLAVNAVQLGSLAYPIMMGGAVAGVASRRLNASILKLSSKRNIRANAARYLREMLFKGLLPKDTQCGAKVFKAEALREVIQGGMLTLDYSFDIELLTRIALAFGAEKIVPVAVAVFDSAALTTTDNTVHFTIMKTQLRIATELRLGSGTHFDLAVVVSKILTSENVVWDKYLELLETRPDLIEAQNRFDPEALAETLELAKEAKG